MPFTKRIGETVRNAAYQRLLPRSVQTTLPLHEYKPSSFRDKASKQKLKTTNKQLKLALC